MYKSRTAVPLLALLAVTGCGPELLGGAQGEVRTVATSDEGGSAQHSEPGTTSPSFGMASAAASADGQASGVTGEILVDAAAWLITEDGDEVALTDGQVPGTFRIEGAGETLLGREDVEARRYTAVRIAFTRVTALVEGGLTLDGEPTVGPVYVDLGATGRLLVERPVQLNVESRTTRTLVLDLDAHEWLPAAVLPGPIVPGYLFAAAVDVRFR